MHFWHFWLKNKLSWSSQVCARKGPQACGAKRRGNGGKQKLWMLRRDAKGCACSELTHRRFQQLTVDYEMEYGDLVMHREVRWLLKGWETTLDQLSLLTDITSHLNALNLELQGSFRATCRMQSEHPRTKWLPRIYLTEISFTSQNSELSPQMTHLCSTSATEDLSRFWKELRGEFESRVSDVNEHEEIFNFIENPLHVHPRILSHSNYHTALPLQIMSLWKHSQSWSLSRCW